MNAVYSKLLDRCQIVIATIKDAKGVAVVVGNNTECGLGGCLPKRK
jgi:hypothetical protein